MRRVYQAAHNIGHFRYIEASEVGTDCQPAGDIAVWDEILFPFGPALARALPLQGVPVVRSGEADQIEEQYGCDAAGVVTVTIRNLTSQYEREFQLGRWSEKAAVVSPALRKRARRASS